MEVTLNISKAAAFNEVSKVTSYIGVKVPTDDGGNLYDHVAVTSDDFPMVEKFWREAIGTLTASMRRFHISSTAPGTGSMMDVSEVFELKVDAPPRFDTSQRDAMEASLFNFFVNYIISRWLPITYKADVEYYQQGSASNMADMLIKLYTKSFPEPVNP